MYVGEKSELSIYHIAVTARLLKNLELTVYLQKMHHTVVVDSRHIHEIVFQDETN